MAADQRDSTAFLKQGEYWKGRRVNVLPGRALLDALSFTQSAAVAGPTPAKLRPEELLLPAAVTRNILRVCKGSDLSLYIVLVALFKCVAARYSGDELSTVLSPLYQREDGDLTHAVLLIQDRLRLEESVRSSIEVARRTVLGAYSNQDYPLDALCGVDGAESLVQNTPLLLLESIHGVDRLPPGCPMAVRFSMAESRLAGVVTYDATRLRPDLVRQFCVNFAGFAAKATEDYSQLVKDVGFLSSSTATAVKRFSRGKRRLRPSVGLHELFEAQARTTPDNIAVVCGAELARYAELDKMAERAACRLREAGLAPGDLVAVRLSSGVQIIATLLAVLKAGAAFMPISLEEPPGRVRSLLGRCRPRMLVSMGDEPEFEDRQPVLRASELLEDGNSGGGWAPALAGEEHTAYVLHTSGSTGEPKAVMVEHRGIVNSVCWKCGEYGFSGNDRVLALFGYTFDGFILNVFAPLASGAAVILMEEGCERDPRAIAKTIERHRVSHVAAAPIVYRAVLREARAGQLGSLRRITLAGDVADPDTVSRSLPGALVSNEYGLTESSVVATFNARIFPEATGVIGQPINNTDVYVLDDDRRLLPPGIVGHLYIGGAGLARGYLGDVERTRQSFVEWNRERLYRSGDLARWLPDGNLEFRGREEQHRKIRGVRVDLAEVRGCLVEHPAVREAVVAAVGRDSSPSICAAVVLEGATQESGLEDYLTTKLPPHLIPNCLLPLADIPLGESGKPDMASVNHLFERALGVEGTESPSTQIERELVHIWRSVLEVDDVGVNQSFFALGGHSLTATVLLAEIHERFGVELLLNKVFSRPTVRELALAIAREAGDRSAVAASPFVADDREAALSSAQERLVALALSQEPNMTYNLPILFEMRGELDEERLHLAVRELMRRHESLRTSFRLVGGKSVQEVSDVDDMVILKRHLKSRQTIRDEIRDVLAPFDLGKAPLFRVALLAADDGCCYLLCDFHHSIVDEISLQVIFEDLSRLYNQARLSEPSPPYREFATWQLGQKASAEYDDRLARWSDELQGTDLEALRLPYDSDAPRKRTFEGDVVRSDVPAELVVGVEHLCKSHEVTPFVFFLTAFAVLLYRYTGQSQIVIGTPVSQRTPAFQKTVGLFLNPVPFVIRVDPALPFTDLLGQVQGRVAEDLANSAVQFEDLVRRMRVDRRYGQNPLFSVAVVILQGDGPRLTFEGVEAERVQVHNGTSKFDLTFEVDLSGGEPQIAIEYAVERFRRDTVVRMTSNLVNLLQSVCSRPEAPVRDIEILSRAERDALLRWGRGKPAGVLDGDGDTLASLFERQATTRPSDVALVLGDHSLTYAELNAEANRLGRRLRSVVSPGDVVAVACGRSIAAVVGMLAVQKAGGAHLPIDPRTPGARIAQLLSDSAASAVIVSGAASFFEGFAGTVIDFEAEDLSGFSPLDMEGLSGSSDGAYVLYTSGTTGKPNGVQVSQRNVVRLIREAGATFGIVPSDVWTLFHSLNFDVSVWEVFGALLHGSRLVIVPEEIAVDARGFLTLLKQENVTVLCQTPSAFYLLADEMLRDGAGLSVRMVLLGGEAIKLRRIEDWYAKYGRSI